MFRAGGISEDCQNFIDATGITDSTQKSAICTLISDLKLNSIWDKMDAIYPYIGGTATTHKFNLKDPRDLDVAFRLDFIGTFTHDSTGVTPSTSYANTFYSEASNNSNGNRHYSIYSRSEADGLFSDFGVQTTSSSNLRPKRGANADYKLNGNGVGPFSVNNSIAHFLVNRLTSSQLDCFRNGTEKISTTTASLSANTIAYVIHANQTTTTPIHYSPRELAFITIGQGLTDTEVENLYNSIQTFQTTLGREI